MKRVYTYIILICSLLFVAQPAMNAQTLRGLVKKGVKVFAKETVEETDEKVIKASVREMTRESAKDFAKMGIKDADSYVGRSLGYELVKKAAREKVEKLMKEDGIKSFLKYGSHHLSKDVGDMGTSKAKGALLKRESHAQYKTLIAENRRNAAKNVTKKVAKGSRMPAANAHYGKWVGERGNSVFVFHPKSKPSKKNYGNLNDQTYEEMGRVLGDPNPQVRYKNGYPVFDRDFKAPGGKPAEIKLEEGIMPYLKTTDLGNRESLHEHAFEVLAKQWGVSVDEVKVFKGDMGAAQKLAKQWNCSVDEVFKRCNNKDKIQRVWHEREDGKTLQLVPRMYHDNVPHDGGIEACKRLAKEIW